MPHHSEPTPSTAPARPSRRVSLAVGAWSVPVIAAAAAAPNVAASPCVTLPNNITVTPGPVARTPAGWTDPTNPNQDGRVDNWNTTADVLSSFTYTNSGTTTVAANTMVAEVLGQTHPGLAASGTSTPYSSLAVNGPLPTGWVLQSTNIIQDVTYGTHFARYYVHVYRYTLPLAPGASAPTLNFRMVATVPRPTPTSYGINLNQAPSPADASYANATIARAGILTCPNTVWGSHVGGESWAVRIPRP